MGQSITVVEKQSSRPGIVRFELNRPLSGMGHERWAAGAAIEGDRPVDELARRLFARGGVDAVHVNGSVVTVTVARGAVPDGLGDVVRRLFRFYPDEPAAPPSADPPAGAAEGHAESEVDPGADPAAEASEEPAAAAVPDAAVPDAAVPDPAVPDPAVPDPAVPDPAVPDAAVPDPAS